MQCLKKLTVDSTQSRALLVRTPEAESQDCHYRQLSFRADFVTPGFLWLNFHQTAFWSVSTTMFFILNKLAEF